MPEKSLRDRVKKARRTGSAPVLKEGDWGEAPVSRHSAKKSSHIIGTFEIAGRNVRRGSPPGIGETRRRELTRDQRRAAYRAENAASGGGRGRLYDVNEPHGKPLALVRGRKKAPGEMNIKHKGGPKRRSPLHGG